MQRLLGFFILYYSVCPFFWKRGGENGLSLEERRNKSSGTKFGAVPVEVTSAWWILIDYDTEYD